MRSRSCFTRVEKPAGGLMAACVLIITFVAHGQFDLSWSTIDGGGGTSPGGAFALTGTVGQPDASAAAAMTGGSYTLTGGFWSVTLPPCASFVRPDFDRDCDVDANDLTIFMGCATGPEIPHDGSPNCQQADANTDTDVDQSDFGIFQRCYSGPNVPVDPNCAN